MENFDSIRWHQVIGRVHHGQATQSHRHDIARHLHLPHLSTLITSTGGDAEAARYLQVNLGFIRRRALARFGFSEVRHD